MNSEGVILSIIVPMYNVGKFIERCLDSIYANPEAEKLAEIILVNDGSPDDSEKVARQWILDHGVGNAKIISQENRGLGGARNAGLRQAAGKWIWFVDSDDEITPGALSAIVSRLDSNLDFIAFNYVVLPSGNIGFKENRAILSKGVDALTETVLAHTPWINIYQRDFLLQHELFFKEKFLHEDNEFSVRVMANATRVGYIPEVIYRYHRDNADSITHKVSRKRIDDLVAHFDTYENLLKATPDKDHLRAMQRINIVSAYWLFRLAESEDRESRNYVISQIIKNRHRIRKAFSIMGLKIRLKILIHTCPFYFQIKRITKTAKK